MLREFLFRVSTYLTGRSSSINISDNIHTDMVWFPFCVTPNVFCQVSSSCKIFQGFPMVSVRGECAVCDLSGPFFVQNISDNIYTDMVSLSCECECVLSGRSSV